MNDAPTVHMYDVLTTMVRDKVAPERVGLPVLRQHRDPRDGPAGDEHHRQRRGHPDRSRRRGSTGGRRRPRSRRRASLPFVSAWTDQFGVFEGSENPEAAKEFIAFLSTEGNRLRARDGQTPFARLHGRRGDGLGRRERGPRRDPGGRQARRGRDLRSRILGCDRPLWDSFALVVEGEMTAQEALDEAAPNMQESLDRAWQTWEET